MYINVLIPVIPHAWGVPSGKGEWRVKMKG